MAPASPTTAAAASSSTASSRQMIAKTVPLARNPSATQRIVMLDPSEFVTFCRDTDPVSNPPPNSLLETLSL